MMILYLDYMFLDHNQNNKNTLDLVDMFLRNNQCMMALPLTNMFQYHSLNIEMLLQMNMFLLSMLNMQKKMLIQCLDYMFLHRN